MIKWGQRRLSVRGKWTLRKLTTGEGGRGNVERIFSLLAWPIKAKRSMVPIALSEFFFSITYTCEVLLLIQDKPSTEKMVPIALYPVILTYSDWNNFDFGFSRLLQSIQI